MSWSEAKRRASSPVHLHHPCRLALAQQRQRALHQRQDGLGLLVPGGGALGDADDALLQRLQVGQHQFGVDDLGIAHRVDAALHMRHVRILEAAHDVRDGIGLADIGQELVAQPLALGGAAHEAGNVHEGEAGGNDLLGLGDGRDAVEARIGHGHVAGIRLDRAERIVRRLRGGRAG